MYNKNMNTENKKQLYGKYLLSIVIVIILASILINSLWNEVKMMLNTGTDRVKASLITCIDGDTAKLNVDGVAQKVRFIAVDTPEIPSNDYYAIEARDYVCDRLTQGPISLEFDDNSDKFDKYDRMIAWIYIGDTLLQEEIVANGYGKVKYIYGDYKYVDKLNELQSFAKKSKVGIWR